MIKSMTGYGVANFENDRYIISAEIKTLNSKFLDFNLRSPRQFSDREIEIRGLVSGVLERGKVNLNIEFTAKSSTNLPVSINQELFETYFDTYQSMASKVGVSDSNDLFRMAIQAPNVVTTLTDKSDDQEEWDAVKKVVMEAAQKCDDFRKDEGETLYHKFKENLDVITKGLDEIQKEEPNRKERIKNRIRNNFKDWMEENSFDENRFEQELIYYFEKLDITEEIVRLSTHLKYFDKTMSAPNSQGKKLGFISQEIGREINTIGSKANDAAIQRHVIIMKDELEKIKEQALNII
ncbi:YicC/YloC family endoribonuclease [Echinicola vietnamensis]|uniref:TIGR00255 family protein n=1 Tax=Echinicola vietnamensis (strain DSM 17526 / LMG 23754 / KMM 6221) TaxID=926556 RepID=L0FYU4_ECHVK|nr:YicC/YloC family endoribonuclease [Echinicola vietnamensis]AGA79069.1 TIGR00255 family protein [Echinicola vietnamensis DSM 17526]